MARGLDNARIQRLSSLLDRLAQEQVEEAMAEALAATRRRAAPLVRRILEDELRQRLEDRSREAPHAARAEPESVESGGESGPEQLGWYVYAVVGATRPRPGQPIPGLDPRFPVELVEDGEHAAVTSRVQLRSIQRASSDPSLLADLVRGHDRVITEAAAGDVAAPLRFGTACGSLDEVHRLLAVGRNRFRRTLAFLRGRDEFGVQVILSAPDPQERGQEEPEPVTDEGNGGATYLQQKASARRAAEERVRVARLAADEAHRVLDGMAVASRPVATARAHPGVVSNVSYLVERSAAERFRGQVADLDGRYGSRGIGIRLTGPWPPYSFADGETVETGDRAHA